MTPARKGREGGNGVRILVVDDDASQRSLLEIFLRGHGYEVVAAESGEEALAILSSQSVQMLISDVRMPGISGLETLRRARDSHVVLPVLLVTAYADIRGAVGAMRDGAVNYLEKPIDLDELLTTVRQAVGPKEAPPRWLPEGLDLPPHVVARSPLTREVFRQASLVAPSDARVLLTGESGVGKEVLADVIHAWSPRAGGPFLKVNCAAIPETLLESELFGHEKGAFTGAVARRTGRFEEAEGGSILLDEVSEMSPGLQAKLLRVTQDGTFERVGSNEARRSDVRVLAATNRNLESEVAGGRFREDLYFRLNVVEVYVPPLRERQADILELAHLFVVEHAKRKMRFSPAFGSCLELYDWPGNVRELKNAMERAVLLAGGELLLPEHLPARIQKAGVATGEAAEGAEGPARGTRMEDVERSLILQTLREHYFSRTETARTLGMSRRALIYKLRRYADEGHDIGPR